MADAKYIIMLEPTNRKQGKRFKNVCKAQGTNMRQAFIAFMNAVINDEFSIQSKLKRNGRKR